MIFVKKECVKCNIVRKFLKDSARDKADICGNCWRWEEKI